MNPKHNARNPELDLIRVFAFFCVVSVHFFLHTGYDDIPILGGRMYVATLIRAFAFPCVPLFLMLSGYLMNRRTPTRQYYRKLIRIIGEYLLASLICIIGNYFLDGRPADVLLFLKRQLFCLFSFLASQYGWYVEMYIGLFLLIPYLNIVYHHMADQKQKRNLVMTMLFLTSVPSVTNSFSSFFGEYEFFFRVIPEWWTGIYPITYYFIGAYLSEHPIRIRKSVLLALILLATLISGTFSYWKSYGNLFVHGSWQDNGSLFNVVLAVLLFSFLQQIPLRSGTRFARILATLSDLTFSAYLVSAIFDRLLYGTLGLFQSPMVYRLEYLLAAAPVVFACSLLLAALVRFLYGILQRPFTRHQSRIPE